MTGRLILVALLGYIAGVLSLAVAIVLGARFRSRAGDEDTAASRGTRYLHLDSGELIALLLRGGGGTSSASERPSGALRRSSGTHLMS
jgi:hypothetical protein